MKTSFIFRSLFLPAMLLTAFSATAQSSYVTNDQPLSTMKTYLIQRDMPGIGQLSPADLKAASQKSCSVLDGMGPKIKWLHSYVTGDKLFCVYQAENEELLREHARRGGFPIT